MMWRSFSNGEQRGLDSFEPVSQFTVKYLFDKKEPSMGYPTPATDIEARILQALSRGGPSFGAEIARQSGGLILKNTAYKALKRMEAREWVESEVITSKSRTRRMYQLTEYGRRALEAHVQLVNRIRQGLKGSSQEEWFNSTEMAKGF